jgi:O-antigen ligase
LIKTEQKHSFANRVAFVLMLSSVIFTTVAYGAVHQPILALFYIIVALMAVLLIADFYVSGKLLFSTNLIQVPLLAAAIYGTIQVIPIGSFSVGTVSEIPRTISLDPFATQVSVLHFFALFLFLAAALILIDSVSRIRKVVIVMMIFGFGYAFFAILQSVLSPDKIYGIYGREGAQPFGSFVNRHNFAAFAEMLIAVPLGLVFAGGIIKDKRLLYLTAAALMGVSLLLSGSRGGFVALIAEVILLVLLTAGSHGRHKLALRFALVALLIGAIVGGAFFVGGESSLTRIADTAKASDLTTGRAEIWANTIKVIGANMPVGAGFGAFGVAYTSHDGLSGMERVEQAHNDYLQVLADAGVVGLLIGGLFLVVLFRQAFGLTSIENNYRRGVAIGAFAGISAVLVHSIFDFVLHTTAVSVAFLTLTALFAASFFEYADDVKNIGEPSHRRKRRSKSVVRMEERRS